MQVPFNKPYMAGKELEYIRQAHAHGQLSGNGPFTHQCNEWLEKSIGCGKALMTHSCTGALEMTALLADLRAGDEVIMPSYTFVSTANAFVLRGVVLVFVDIRSDTLNIDETKIEEAITPKTKAIVAVHYAGVGCEMDSILAVAAKHSLLVIEDAAQGIGAQYKGRPLGSVGNLGALSFHETKNIISGEGGALLVNDNRFVKRAEIIWEKGTNRKQFMKGEVDKYSWVDIGSSYLPSDLIAAFLWAQLEEFKSITGRRMDIWKVYHEAFQSVEEKGFLRRPVIPAYCDHNAHMYYVLLPNREKRDRFLSYLQQAGIQAIFHFIPLHSSPAGRRFGRTHGVMKITEEMSERIVRLPLWIGLETQQEYVISQVRSAFAH